MRELSLCLARVVELFYRGNKHASAALLEVFVMGFELNQLDHAERSPPAAEKHQYVVRVAAELALRKP